MMMAQARNAQQKAEIALIAIHHQDFKRSQIGLVKDFILIRQRRQKMTIREILEDYGNKCYKLAQTNSALIKQDLHIKYLNQALAQIIVELPKEKWLTVEEAQRYVKCDGTPIEWTNGMVYGYNTYRKEVKEFFKQSLYQLRKGQKAPVDSN